jgi:hypothetical protein
VSPDWAGFSASPRFFCLLRASPVIRAGVFAERPANSVSDGRILFARGALVGARRVLLHSLEFRARGRLQFWGFALPVGESSAVYPCAAAPLENLSFGVRIGCYCWVFAVPRHNFGVFLWWFRTICTVPPCFLSSKPWGL